jgi:hypothetical protein
MALSTDRKLYVSVGVLAVLGGALYLQKQSAKKEEAAYTLSGRMQDLPKLKITEEDTKKVDRIVISKSESDAGAASEVVLDKKDDKWFVSKPISAPAQEANVKSVLDNLKLLEITERIAAGKEQYAQFGVSDDKATHVTIYKGADKLLDAYLGDGGSRGQMGRLAGKDGVYAVKGYSNYLYARELKGWRDLSLLSFDDSKTKSVEIDNEHGSFVFTKLAAAGDKKEDASDAGAKPEVKWDGKFKPAKGGAPRAITRFDETKVNDLLRTYKSLNADNFAQGKTDADVGLDKPMAKLTVTLEDGGKRVIMLGSTAEGTSRWAKKDGDPQIYSVSSFAAEWITSDDKKFQKPEEKKGDAGTAAPAEMPNPHMMNPHSPH